MRRVAVWYEIKSPFVYEFNASPETVLPIFDGPVGSVLYSTILLPPCFRPLFHHSQHDFRQPWRRAALAHTIACGPMTPQPSAQVSPPHHG